MGAGDTAAEEATYLSKICNKVIMLVRKDHFRASKAMVHRVMNTSNIEVKFNHELVAIEGENNLVERAVAINNITNEKSTIDVHGIFIAIGHKPNTEVFGGQLDLDENGYILTEKDLPEQTFLVYLQREMFRITYTDRQLQLQEVVVWLQWMLKNILAASSMLRIRIV